MISCHRQRSPNSRPWRPLRPPGRPAKTRTATAWPTCRWRSWPPEPGSLAPPCTGCSAASRACSKSLALRRRRWCAAASSTPPWTWSAGTAWPSCRWRSWPPPPGSLAPPCTGCFPARRRCSPFEPIAAVLETKGDRPPAEVIPAVAHVMATAMEGHIGLLLQLLFEFSRSRPGSHAGADFQEDAANAMRTLPLVAGYLAEQMAAGRLRRMDPVLAVQALAGPIVMHLLMQAPAESQPGPGRGVALPLEEVVDELVGIWLRAMTPDDGEHHQHQRRASRIRSKHHDQTDAPGAAPAPPGQA